MIVHCCHCTWCQRETAQAFAINALIEVANIRLLSGSIIDQTIQTKSGQGQILRNCSRCNTTLWSHYAYAGIGEQVAFIRVNTLEEEHQLTPDVHIYTSSKQAGVTLPENIPTSLEYYRASEVWRPDALARRQKLFDQLKTSSLPGYEKSVAELCRHTSKNR